MKDLEEISSSLSLLSGRVLSPDVTLLDGLPESITSDSGTRIFPRDFTSTISTSPRAPTDEDYYSGIVVWQRLCHNDNGLVKKFLKGY